MANPTAAVFFYIRISGLPYIFASHSIPSAWEDTPGSGTTTISSEVYTWSKTLISDSDFASVSSKLELKAGIASSGGLRLRFATTGNQAVSTSDVWLDLINNSVNRSDANYCTLITNLTASATAIAGCNTVAGFAGSDGVIYMSTETIAYSVASGTTFQTLVRGRYGSPAHYHVGIPDGIEETGAGGAIVCDKPLNFMGRIVEVWMATGSKEDGVVTPFGATAMSTEDWNIYKGVVVANPDLDSSLLTVEIDTASIDKLLQNKIARRLPTARAGVPDFDGWQYIQIDDSCNMLSWTWNVFDTVTAANSLLLVASKRLQRDNGSNVSEDVPDGRYFFDVIGSYIQWTIRKHSGDVAIGDVDISLENTGTETEPVFTLKVELPSLGFTGFRLLFDRDNVLWPELGFEGEQSSEVQSSGVGVELQAPRGAAAFRWPTGSRTRRLYLHDETGPAFDASVAGVTDDDTNAVDGFVRIGKQEVASFNEYNTSTATRHYLVVDGRNEFGSRPQEELYVEWESDKKDLPQVVQGLCFPDVSFLRMLLFLMLSDGGDGGNHATWDKLWRGSGAAIPSQLVNVSAITDLDAARNDQRRRNGYCFFEPTKLRDAIQGEMILNQMFLAPVAVAAGYTLKVLENNAPNDSETGTTIDHTTVWSRGQGVSFIKPPLINEIKVKADIDNATGKFRREYTQINATSRATFGDYAALSISVRGILGGGVRIKAKEGLRAAIRRFTQQIWSEYGWPYAVVEFDIAAPLTVWTWQIGDVVTITHDALPAELAIGRGWTTVNGRIFAITYYYQSQGRRARVTCIIKRFGGRRMSTWCPSASLSAKSSDTAWTAAANAYTDAGSGNDLTHWDAGDEVRGFTEGDESGAETATIATASGTAIVFDAPGITLAAPIIIESADHDDASIAASQLNHVYMSDGDGVLNKSSGTAVEYRWKG